MKIILKDLISNQQIAQHDRQRQSIPESKHSSPEATLVKKRLIVPNDDGHPKNQRLERVPLPPPPPAFKLKKASYNVSSCLSSLISDGSNRWSDVRLKGFHVYNVEIPPAILSPWHSHCLQIFK